MRKLGHKKAEVICPGSHHQFKEKKKKVYRKVKISCIPQNGGREKFNMCKIIRGYISIE